jgi:hypothetical protein
MIYEPFRSEQAEPGWPSLDDSLAVEPSPKLVELLATASVGYGHHLDDALEAVSCAFEDCANPSRTSRRKRHGVNLDPRDIGRANRTRCRDRPDRQDGTSST